MIRPLSVLGFGYVDASASGAGELPKLDLSLLERTLRRGLSDTTRMFMHSARLAIADAAVDPRELHVIFASAFGEIATADALLLEAYSANASSPARFRNSVHNTTTGLFSISTKNQLPSTAIAAGWDTVAMALCEASAQLAADAERVLLVFAEERVPLSLSAAHPYGPLGVALVLAREGVGPSRGHISNLSRQSARPESESVSFIESDQHPLAPALLLALRLAGRHAGTVVVGEGPLPWSVELAIEVAA